MPGRSTLGRRVSIVTLVVVAGVAVSASAQQPAAGSGGNGVRQRDRMPADDNGGRRGGGFGGGMFGGRGQFEQSYTSKSLEEMGKTLALTADQQTAAKALLEGYQQSFQTMSGAARDKMSEMRENMRADGGDGPNPDAFRTMGEEMDKFRKSKADLDTGFLNDLKAVLTPEQTDKWPAVERMNRREQTVGRGLMSGERVDLIKLVDGLKLPEKDQAPLTPVLEQYAADLDHELVARNTTYDSAQSKIREMFRGGGGGGDTSAMDKVFEEGRAASTRVRDVNRRYARQIAGLLPEDVKAEFDDQVRRESYPLVYRGTYGSKALKAAAEMTDLDESQKSTVQTISQAYAHDLAAVNKELEEAADKREASLKPQDMMPGRGGRGGGGGGWGGWMDDPEITKLSDRRTVLQDSTLDKLKAVLKPEQFEALPKRTENRRGGDAGGGQANANQDDQPARPRRGGTGTGGQDRPTAPKQPAPGPTR